MEVEFKRRTAFIKKYNLPEGASASVTSDGGCSADREGDRQEPGPAETADREGDRQDPEPAERDNGRDEGQNGRKLPEPEAARMLFVGLLAKFKDLRGSMTLFNH